MNQDHYSCGHSFEQNTGKDRTFEVPCPQCTATNGEPIVGEQQQPVRMIDVLIIGGVADGQLLQGVRNNATLFELSRPNHIKPVMSMDDETPTEKGVYALHVIRIRNTGENGERQMGIGLPEGVPLSLGFSDLVKAYVRDFTRRAIDDGRIDPDTVH